MYFLKKEQFIQSLGDGKLSPTPLGVATTISGIAPKDAVVILKPLMDARHKLILKGGLHPVYLVTPPSTAIEPDWKNYERMLDLLYQEQPDAINVVSILLIHHPSIYCILSNKTHAFCSLSIMYVVDDYDDEDDDDDDYDNASGELPRH